MDEPAVLPGKRVSESRLVLAQLMQPVHANNQGNVHGGEIMRLMDEAGALACMRHASHRVVTVAVEQVDLCGVLKNHKCVCAECEGLW